MSSFQNIIDTIGAPALAKLLGLTESHVRVMRARNSIPAEYWGVVIEVLPELTHARLREMRSGRFAKVAFAASDEGAAA